MAPRRRILADRSHSSKFHEAQIALAREWISQGTENTQTQVATTQGPVVLDQTPKKKKTVKISQSVGEARGTVGCFEAGAEGIKKDEDAADTVVQHMLNGRTGLDDERRLGTEEELNTMMCIF
ncbi:hypothetical protein H0H87_002743 [Tephrocybe sp. NHM501043]|nr:hypothetical protein H0H87_002743 [Tephrocybe sp. NHM501043]